MQDVRQLVAGDSLSFSTTVDQCPAADGWTLRYRLTPRFTTPTQASLTLTATVNTDGTYQVDLYASDTAEWKPGVYGWASSVERAGERITLQRGEVTVLQDPETAAPGYDGRSDAEIALADCIAARKAFKPTIHSYRINDREVTYRSVDDIDKDIAFWRRQVARERNAAGMALGQANRRKILGRVARA